MNNDTMLNRRARAMQQSRDQIKSEVLSQNVALNEEELAVKHNSMARIVDLGSHFLNKMDLTEAEKEQFRNIIKRVVREESYRAFGRDGFESQIRVEKVVMDIIFGLGPLQTYMEDPDISDIIVASTKDHGIIVTVEKNGVTQDVDVTFENEDELRMLIDRIVQQCGRTINIVNPMVDASLADGSRVNACIRPVAVDGPCLAVRKFREIAIKGEDYLRLGSMTPNMLKFLSLCVKARVNILVSGGTGSGKTTMLNLLSGYIPENDQIVTIEDTPELQLQQLHVRRKTVRLSNNQSTKNVDQKALVRNALRERPDRIILGEIRDESIVDMLSAMSTGHEGSMCTVHADNVDILFGTRIPTMFPSNEFSERQVSMMVAGAIQVVVQIRRFPDGARRVTEIAVVDGIGSEKEGNPVITKTLYGYDNKNKRFYCTGIRPEALIEYALWRDVELPDELFREESS